MAAIKAPSPDIASLEWPFTSTCYAWDKCRLAPAWGKCNKLVSYLFHDKKNRSICYFLGRPRMGHFLVYCKTSVSYHLNKIILALFNSLKVQVISKSLFFNAEVLFMILTLKVISFAKQAQSDASGVKRVLAGNSYCPWGMSDWLRLCQNGTSK